MLSLLYRIHRQSAGKSAHGFTSCIVTPTQEDEEQNGQMQALRQLHCCQWGWMRRGMRSTRGEKHCGPQMVLSKLMSKCYVFLFLLQCGLALHRKCMEMCQLECEHRKGTVFGVDLAMLPRTGPDEVPFVVLLCTSEIESRALSVQVLLTITSSQWPTRRGKKVRLFAWSTPVFLSGSVSSEWVQASHPKALSGLWDTEEAGGPFWPLATWHHLDP